MMSNRWALAALTIALLAPGANALVAQDTKPRWPGFPQERGMFSEGLPVTPLFEGWYPNPDGSYTLSFGFLNRNQEEVIELEVGPDNFIEPAEFNGLQPTLFAPGRDTGVFTVTVPGSFAENDGRVVWTLRANGTVHSVPGKVGVTTNELSYRPMGMGSLPPSLRLTERGPQLWGPMAVAGNPGIQGSTVERTPLGSLANPLALRAKVGEPLALTAWVADRLGPEPQREPVPGGVTWFTHQGPALAEFTVPPSENEDEGDEDEARSVPDSSGRVTATAVFREPGEYLLRARADNFNPVDSTPGDQCCWTNGYIKVTVTP